MKNERFNKSARMAMPEVPEAVFYGWSKRINKVR
jgi:hypothetical protein